MAAVSYGIVHDEITARLCIEYFTVTHSPLIASRDPTAVGLFWGIFATWWVGIPLGGGLAAACCLRPIPTLPGDIVAPLVRLLGLIALCAFLGGVFGYLGYSAGWLRIPEDYSDCIPLGHHAWFLVDSLADLAGCIAGFPGGLLLIVLAATGRYASGKPAFTIN